MMITETTVPRRLVEQPRGVENTFCGGVLMDELTPVCAQPTKAYPGGRTGTDAGSQAHRSVGEAACPPCAQATKDKAAALRARPDWAERKRVEYQNNRAKYTARNLLYKHGMTVEQYDALLAAQGGGCALCGTTEPKGRGGERFHVDHDHACCPGQRSCGKCVRALLCAHCNVGLGSFGDDPERLREAARYIEAHRKGVPWTRRI